MTTLDKFSEYLDNDFSANYWADDAIDYATELATLLSDNEWHRLKQTWRYKPVNWQFKCAEAVFGTEKPQAIDLLEKMLTSTEVKVALAAAEGLEASDWKPNTNNTFAALEKLLNELEENERSTVENLMERSEHDMQHAQLAYG